MQKTVFGSHLYGTATPTSDNDVRGVFIPDKRAILLGRIPRTSKEEAGNEEDYELYSLHHFVKLACEGQTVALDMLWTPERQVMKGECWHVWQELHALRWKFISKRMNAFIGYARGQATKYSLKGERLQKLEAFLDVLKPAQSERATLSHFWFDLPKDDERTSPQGVAELQIAGKWFGATTQVHHVRESLEATLKAYGSRANAAADSGGVDWKAMSHAVRVSIELKELITSREIQFPLRNARLLLDIKQGRVDLGTVQIWLDKLLTEVEDYSASSDLPEKVDHVFWENWLAETVERETFK